MPSQRYTIVIDSELSGAERAKAILDQIQDQAGEGVGELVLKSEIREAEDAKQLILEIEELAEKPNRIQLDTSEALRKAEKLGEELDEQLAERKVKIETQTAATGSPAAKSAAGSVAADVAVFASLQDLQEQAAKNLSENPIGIDPEKLDEVKKILKEIDQLAKDRSEFNLDTAAAEAKAEKLKKRLEELGHAPKDSGDGFIGKLKRDFEDLKGEIPILGKIGDLAGILSRGPLALMAGAITGIAFGWKGAAAGVRAYLAEAPKFAEFDAVLAQHAALTKANRKEFIGLASDMQDATNVADDQWIEVISRLIQFGSDPRTVGVDLEAVKNLTALFKGDSRRATELYTRALKGQFSQFAELGIVIDQQLSQEEKLNALRKEAAGLGDGVLEAQARTAAGSVKALGNEIGDLTEGIGRVVARSVLFKGSVGAIRTVVRSLVTALPEAAEEVEGLTLKLPELKSAFDENSKSAQEFSQKVGTDISKSFATATKALADYIARLRELEQAELLLTDKKLSRDLAQIDLDEAEGTIGAPEANRRRFEVREQAETRKVEIKTISLEKALEANTTALKEQEAKLDSLEQLASERREARDTARTELTADLAARREQNLKEQKEVAAELAQLRRELEFFRNKLLSSPNAQSIDPELPGLISALGSDIKAAQERQDDLKEEAGNSLRPGILEVNKQLTELDAAFAQAVDAVTAQVKDLEKLRVEIPRQNQSLTTQLETLREGSSIDTQSRSLGRSTQLSEERKKSEEEARKLEQERARAGFREESQATAATAARFFNRSQAGKRRFGESDREYKNRQFNVEELRAQGLEAAKALRDGSTPEELEALTAAFREFIGNVDSIAQEQGRVQVQIKTLTRMVEQAANHTKNNR